jgi:SRSO17 transposase
MSSSDDTASTSINRPRSKSSLSALPKRSWRRIKWREGTAEHLSSRFARLRVRVAHRDYALTESRPEEWLLIEWPESEEKPAKYWLSTLPKNITFRKLADLTKLRWRIERDYQELKQEVGLGHFEGRGWRGFHRHATLCIAAYGFLGEDSPLTTLLRPSVQKTCRSRK